MGFSMVLMISDGVFDDSRDSGLDFFRFRMGFFMILVVPDWIFYDFDDSGWDFL